MVHAAFNNKKTLFNSKLGPILGRNEQSATFGPYLCMSPKLGLFERYIKNTPISWTDRARNEVLECQR